MGAGEKQDVNAIWAQLNASKGTGSARASRVWENIKSGNDPAKPATAKRPDASAAVSKAFPSPSPAATRVEGAVVSRAQGIDVSGIATEEELGKLLQRDLYGLKDTVTSTRKVALERLLGCVQTASPDLLEGLAVDPLAKGALRRFEDSSEKCREMAIRLVSALVDRVPDCVYELMPYAMPTLLERIATTNEAPKGPVEQSEELRVLLHRLLAAFIRATGPAVAPYGSDCVQMLEVGAEDPCPEVVAEACLGLAALVAALGRRLGTSVKNLAWAFMPNLTHKRSRVRVAAIEALTPLLVAGGHECILDLSAFRSPNVIPIKAFYGDDLKVNYFGKLATDTVPGVRAAFLDMIGTLMLTMDERNEHEARLLPYVLSAMCDEAASIQKTAMETMDRLGQNYEKENEKELREILTYYKEEYETDAGFYGDSGGTAEGEDGDGDDRPKSAAELLPPPFGGRPRLGSRLMVKNQFPRMSPGCLAELQAWQAALRPRAAALLLAMLVFQERTVAPQLPAVLPALWSAIDDADRTVQTRVTTAAQLVGRLAPPAAWLDQVADRIENDTDISSAARAATASLLAALLDGAARRPEVTGKVLETVLRALSESTITESVDPRLRGAALNALAAALNAAPGKVAEPFVLRGLKLALSLRSLPALALSTGAPAEAALAAADRALAAAARAGGFAGGAPELISAHRGELLRAEAEAAADAAAAGRACWAESDASRVLLIAGDAELSELELESLSKLFQLALSSQGPDAASEPLLAAAASLPWLRGAARARSASLCPTPLHCHPLGAVAAALGCALGPSPISHGAAVRKAALGALAAWVGAAQAAGLRHAGHPQVAAGPAADSHSDRADATTMMRDDGPFPMAATCAQAADGETEVRAAALAAFSAAVCARCCGPTDCAVAAAAACARLDDAADSLRGAAADALARMAPHLPTESAARSLEAARAPHRLAPESDLSADSAVALRRCLAALEGAPAAAAALAAAEEEEAKSWAWVAHGDGAGSPSGSADDGRCGASSDDSTGAAGSAPPMPAVSGPAGGLLLNDSGDSSKAVSAANAEAAATPAVALGGVGGAVPTAAAAEAGDDDSATGNKRSSSGDEQEDKTELFSLD